MNTKEILFNTDDQRKSQNFIWDKISEFGESYIEATKDIINHSKILDIDGKVFIKCASRILSNFGMTTNGPFSSDYTNRLRNCWDIVGDKLIEINYSILESGYSRGRYILSLMILSEINYYLKSG